MERLKSVRTTAGARPVRNRYEGKGYYYLRGGDFFPELIEEMNAGNGASDLCLKELDRQGMLFHSREEADNMSEKVRALFKAEARDGFHKCP